MAARSYCACLPTARSSCALTPDQRVIVGGRRGKFRNWIASLVPRDEEVGYLMAMAPAGVGAMVGFSGVTDAIGHIA
jgi:hypothetical protein